MSFLKSQVDKTVLFLRQRKTAYQLMFGQPAGRVVMMDLLKYSHWLKGPYGKDDRETYRLIGRQDVIRRIAEHMGLSVEQLFGLYNGLPTPIIQAEEEPDNG